MWRDVNEMKKLVDRALYYIAVLAKGAAVFSVGKASMGGMYEPKMPEDIIRIQKTEIKDD